MFYKVSFYFPPMRPYHIFESWLLCSGDWRNLENVVKSVMYWTQENYWRPDHNLMQFVLTIKSHTVDLATFGKKHLLPKRLH